MPIYEHLCEKGHKFDRFLKLADLDDIQTCECGQKATRLISTPHFMVDIPAYVSPATGKLITSRTQRREDLKASGCVEYEPSMVEESNRKRRQEDDKLDKMVEEHVEKTIYEMPTEKRDKLAAEMECGFDINITRA